jgi:hypothetical protein
MNALRTLPTTTKETLESSEGFAALLPCIQRQLTYAFRRLEPGAAEEAVQEGVANCFVAYVRLRQQGREGLATAGSLAGFAARHVRAGRSVGSSLSGSEVLSHYAQLKNGFRVDRFGGELSVSIEEAVTDRRTSIPDRVALRIDVPRWLKTLSRTMQRIARDLALGNRTADIAAKYRLTPGRVSQIRRELYGSWQQFHDRETLLS